MLASRNDVAATWRRIPRNTAPTADLVANDERALARGEITAERAAYLIKRLRGR